MVGHTHSNAKDNFTVIGSGIFSLRFVIQLICSGLANITSRKTKSFDIQLLIY